MQLGEYQWSGNPRGLHNEGAYKPIDHNRLTRLNLGWYKMVTGGEEFANDCAWMLSQNITPIVRIYRGSPGAAAPDDSIRNQWGRYIGAGVKWFEFFNEPNFPDPEWPDSMKGRVDYRNVDEVIKPLCDSWMMFAEFIVNQGGYPGFFALGETSGENGAIQWMDALLGYLRDHHGEKFTHIINNGLWWATHPYALNHWYQEIPGQPSVPRPPATYNGLERGWHFEYPYDPYTQSFDPGRTAFGGTPSAPFGDPNGITAMGRALNERLQEWFGAGPLPVFGTEGGIYPLPTHDPQQPDPRFPAYDRAAHAEATIGMFNWIAIESPVWMYGLALWKEDEYYNNQLPAVAKMESIAQIRKGSQWPNVPTRVKGPGPVIGEPTFHAVILAPGIDPQWFMESGRSYWNTFRPIVTTVWDFINYIPYDRSLAATVITPPDLVESMKQVIQNAYPNVLFDLIITGNTPQTVADVLNARVWSNRRFG